MAKRFKERFHLGRPSSESDGRTSTGSIAGIMKTLKVMGCNSLGWQLSVIAFFSFFSGLAQAAILVIVSEFAVNSAQGKKHLVVYGHSISIGDSIVMCVVLLFVYSGAGIAASVSTSNTFTKALAAVRAKMINAFFRSNWRIQSQERLGHFQQLLTFNCEKAAEITLSMALGLQSFLTLSALLLVAFLVSPIAAALVLGSYAVVQLQLARQRTAATPAEVSSALLQPRNTAD